MNESAPGHSGDIRNRETLEAAAALLLERETLAEAELREFAARLVRAGAA